MIIQQIKFKLQEDEYSLPKILKIWTNSFHAKSIKIFFHYNFFENFMDYNCINPNFYFSNTNLLIFACDNEFVDDVKKLLQYDVIDVFVIDPSAGNAPIFSVIIRNNP